MNLFKMLWRSFTHKIKLDSNEDTVIVKCSCGWMTRCDGAEMWSEASHATDLHLGLINRVQDCTICRKEAKL